MCKMLTDVVTIYGFNGNVTRCFGAGRGSVPSWIRVE